MPSSTENNQLPDGVSPEELYEGPKVVPLTSGRATFLAPDPSPEALIAPIPQAPARQLPAQPAPPPPQIVTADVKAAYPAALELAWDVLSTRLHFLVALVTACLIWAWVIWDPEIHRVVAAGAFSAAVFWPMALIYWRAGMPGEKGG